MNETSQSGSKGNENLVATGISAKMVAAGVAVVTRAAESTNFKRLRLLPKNIDSDCNSDSSLTTGISTKKAL